MRAIIAAIALAWLSGCATLSDDEIHQRACEICVTERPCQVPPELHLVEQGALTLPAPNVKLVHPKSGDPYFVMTEQDFYVWLDNNSQLANHIRECRTRVQMVKEYYEISIEPIRNHGKVPNIIE